MLLLLMLIPVTAVVVGKLTPVPALVWPLLQVGAHHVSVERSVDVECFWTKLALELLEVVRLVLGPHVISKLFYFNTTNAAYLRLFVGPHVILHGKHIKLSWTVCTGEED